MSNPDDEIEHAQQRVEISNRAYRLAKFAMGLALLQLIYNMVRLFV